VTIAGAARRGPQGLDEVLAALDVDLADDRPVALATVIALSDDTPTPEDSGLRDRAPALGASLLVRPEGRPVGSLGHPDLDASVVRDALGSIDAGTTGVSHYGRHGELRREDVSVFVQAFTPAPRLVIFGAVDFSASLATVGKVLGFHVTVCDARRVFATSARFPMADEVVVDWPDRYLAQVGARLGRRDAVCVLTHDPKFDVPAVMGALATSVGYIGAMGSRRTTAAREERLREAGADDADLARVMAPIGLDIGARTPAETAVSICAEIIAARAGGGSGSSLRASGGPIHHPLAVP
jgi:xanthine dehydrogenase accessory factor